MPKIYDDENGTRIIVRQRSVDDWVWIITFPFDIELRGHADSESGAAANAFEYKRIVGPALPTQVNRDLATWPD